MITLIIISPLPRTPTSTTLSINTITILKRYHTYQSAVQQNLNVLARTQLASNNGRMKWTPKWTYMEGSKSSRALTLLLVRAKHPCQPTITIRNRNKWPSPNIITPCTMPSETQIYNTVHLDPTSNIFYLARINVFDWRRRNNERKTCGGPSTTTTVLHFKATNDLRNISFAFVHPLSLLFDLILLCSNVFIMILW